MSYAIDYRCSDAGADKGDGALMRFAYAFAVMLVTMVAGGFLVSWLIDHEYYNVLTSIQIAGIACFIALGVFWLMHTGRRQK